MPSTCTLGIAASKLRALLVQLDGTPFAGAVETYTGEAPVAPPPCACDRHAARPPTPLAAVRSLADAGSIHRFCRTAAFGPKGGWRLTGRR
jgi:hypothetical protein